MHQTTEQRQFATLLQEHRAVVYKVINTYCANDEWLQDDLFQEISLKAWAAFNSFTGKSKFSTWLWSIARNTAIDRLRRLKPFKTILLENVFWEIKDTDYEEAEPVISIPSVIEKLSDIERRTLLMRMDGIPFTQISQETGEPENRLRVRMHRLKSELATSIKKQINKHQK